MDQTVITGMGVISSAGVGLDEFWNNLKAGKITYGDIEEYKNNKNYRITVGARVSDEKWKDNLNQEYRNKYGKASQYAVSASLSALEDAGLRVGEYASDRIAIVIGTTMGEIQVEEEISLLRHSSGLEEIPQHLLKHYKTANISCSVREALQAEGPVYTVPAACAAGNYAMAFGKHLMEMGYADIVVAGGVDVFSRVAFTGFQRLLSLAPDICRPFDKGRKGLVVGEGCGIAVLERESSAKARGARIHGVLSGVGLSSDRYHMTSPHPDGDGAIRAMRSALAEAGIMPGDIDYVSAHGTGTPANDRIECKALEAVFGEGRIPPVSSIKSMIGHAMGAASSLELIASIQMMRQGIMLPTINYSEPDPECRVDCVPNISRKESMKYILSNSFAFGGQVSSIVVKGGD